MSDLYEHDFFAWVNLQSQLLREGRVTEADRDHIKEKIEALGANRRNELRNRLAVLLMHLLKREYQPGHRSRSWRLTLNEQHARIVEHLEEHPSLRPLLGECFAKGYGYALLRAERETGLALETCPAPCLLRKADILDVNFLPGGP